MKKDDKTTGESFADKFLDSKLYETNLKLRLESGILAPMLEKRLWEYKFGRPVEKVAIEDARHGEYSEMTEAELAQRAKDLHDLALLLSGVDAPEVKTDPELMN